jgi:hypothetical protein
MRVPKPRLTRQGQNILVYPGFCQAPEALNVSEEAIKVVQL